MGVDSREAARELLRHERRIRLFFCRHLESEHDIDDLTQETLLVAWSAFTSFRSESTACTWMHGIAKRLLWNYYRKARHGAIELRDDAPAASCPGDDMRLGVKLALETLGRGDRDLYDLFYICRMSVREIASSSGEPEGTVKYRLFILRKRMRSMLS